MRRRRLLQAAETSIQECLAQSIGVLVCKGGAKSDDGTKRVCLLCSPQSSEDEGLPSDNDDLSHVTECLWKVELTLIHSGQGAARKHALRSLSAFLAHMPLADSVSLRALAQTCFETLMSHESTDVRQAVVQVSPFFFRTHFFLRSSPGSDPDFEMSVDSQEVNVGEMLQLLGFLKGIPLAPNCSIEHKCAALSATGEIILHDQCIPKVKLYAFMILVRKHATKAARLLFRTAIPVVLLL